MDNEENWNNLTKGKYFITDLGKTIKASGENGELIVGRYAVWKPMPDNQHAIMEVSADLQYLKKKYHIKGDEIFKLTHSKK